MHGLKSAAGFIQTKVADKLTTRFVPHITFVLDEGVKKSVEIARIIREENEQLAADRAAAGKTDEPHPETDSPNLLEDEDEPEDEPEHTKKSAEKPGPAADGPADRPV